MKAGKAKVGKAPRFCPMCGSAMRERAIFCHRCGRPMPDESAVVYAPEESKNAVIAAQEFSQPETFKEPKENVSASIETAAPEIVPSDKLNQNGASGARISEKETAPERAASEIEENAPPLPKPRRVVKTTQYVWEESGSDPTWRFVLFTIVAVAFAVFVFWLARFIHF